MSEALLILNVLGTVMMVVGALMKVIDARSETKWDS
jgi:hypothetical protein